MQLKINMELQKIQQRYVIIALLIFIVGLILFAEYIKITITL